MNQRNAPEEIKAWMPAEGTLEMVSSMWSTYLGKPVTGNDVLNLLTITAMSHNIAERAIEKLPDHLLVSEFWRVLDEAEINGESVNLSKDIKTVALRMAKVRKLLLQAGWNDRQVAKVKKLLPHYSPHPLLEKNACIHDWTTQKTCRGWIFRRRQLMQ